MGSFIFSSPEAPEGAVHADRGFDCPDVACRVADFSVADFDAVLSAKRRAEELRLASGEPEGGRKPLPVVPRSRTECNGQKLLEKICDLSFIRSLAPSGGEKASSDDAAKYSASVLLNEGFFPTGIALDDGFRKDEAGIPIPVEALYILFRHDAQDDRYGPPFMDPDLWSRVCDFLSHRAETRRRLYVVLVWIPKNILSSAVNHAYFERNVHVESAVSGDVSSRRIVPVDPQPNDDPVLAQARVWIRDAIARNASDIHLEPTEGGGRIRIRVDGLLETLVRDVSTGVMGTIVQFVKESSQMDSMNSLAPDDGSMRISYHDARRRKILDVRVSSIPVVCGQDRGQKLVLRLLDPASFGDRLRGGLDGTIVHSPSMLGMFRAALDTRDGIVLVTGPTGSGKTTTLNIALLEILEKQGELRNIVTIEDPVEYTIKGVNQTEINEAAGLTFASALRSLLRQDPDIMLVGEIRDRETAQIAVQAALTGHLILATLHTNDALGSVSRMQDLGVTPFLLGSTLRLVQAQRLVRRLCPACGRREEDRFRPEDLERMRFGDRLSPFVDRLAAPGATVFRPHEGGCARCNGSGFSSRVAVMEMAASSPDLVSAIESNVPVHELERVARRASGWRPMVEHGVDLVAAGVTSPREIDAISLKELAEKIDRPPVPSVAPAAPAASAESAESAETA